MKKIEGLIPALFAPLDKKGRSGCSSGFVVIDNVKT